MRSTAESRPRYLRPLTGALRTLARFGSTGRGPTLIELRNPERAVTAAGRGMLRFQV